MLFDESFLIFLFVINREHLFNTRRVIEWKKVNVNKVSDSFDTCRRLEMILLEELEWLSIDIFIKTKKGVSFVDTKRSVYIAQDYIIFLQHHSSTDNRRRYMFGYVIMATEFRKYWTACRCGDRVVIEDIQNKWIGVRLLSSKHKCVENYLTGMEIKYKRFQTQLYKKSE